MRPFKSYFLCDVTAMTIFHDYDKKLIVYADFCACACHEVRMKLFFEKIFAKNRFQITSQFRNDASSLSSQPFSVIYNKDNYFLPNQHHGCKEEKESC